MLSRFVRLQRSAFDDVVDPELRKYDFFHSTMGQTISIVPIHLSAHYKCKVQPNTVKVLKKEKGKNVSMV